MRVSWYGDADDPNYSYNALKEAKEPCVLLKLYAHGGHDENTGNELNEALLVPASVIAKAGEPISVRLIEAAEAAYERYVKHELAGVREHLLRLEGMVYQVQGRQSGQGESPPEMEEGLGLAHHGLDIPAHQGVCCINCGVRTIWGEAKNWRRVWQGEPGHQTPNFTFCPNCPDAVPPTVTWGRYEEVLMSKEEPVYHKGVCTNRFSVNLRFPEEEVKDLDRAGFRALVRAKLNDLGDELLRRWDEEVKPGENG